MGSLSSKLIQDLLLFLCPVIFVQVSASAQRTKVNLNSDWLYSDHPYQNIDDVSDISNWTSIDLPHTWNNEDATDNLPGYRRNISWYKRQLNIAEVDTNLKYGLYFEGSNITTQVYVNGQLAGSHIGGYVGFEIDISNQVGQGTNEILVRVDNSYDPDIIPSQKSDFIIFGGITRDVWFITKHAMSIADLKLSSPQVSEEEAELLVSFSIPNYTNQEDLFAEIVIKDPEGQTVKSLRHHITGVYTELLIASIEQPKLWDIDNPALYDINISIRHKNLIVDRYSQSYGFRWFEFKEYGAFYLNGKRMLLRGTHRHEEHAGVGAAMTNEMHRADIELIKEMGANFIRLAHYPQDPEVYKACDELGILVWDELPWCRGGIGKEQWKSYTRKMLRDMISQNYNHPSIIIWSLGNEVYWLPDFEKGDDIISINAFLQELDTLAHHLDPYRKTALRKYYEGSDIVDVFSPSIWSGWYSGSYKNYQKALDTYKERYKHFIHAEYGGSSHFGRHSENPINGEGEIQSEGWQEAIVQTGTTNIAQIGDWSENYIVDLFDWHLRISETDSNFVGNAQWAFKDFATPLRPENAIPYMNQKGLVDRNNRPKDAFFVFKSYWAKDPFVYIESHTWTERQGPKGVARNISVYSNCTSVRLFHNGHDLGEKSKDINEFPASGLNWDVHFEEGENHLVAYGYGDFYSLVKDSIQVDYRYAMNSKAQGLELSVSERDEGVIILEAIAVDKDGLRCLDYEKKVYFQCLQGGSLLNNQGTPYGSDVIEMANGKANATLIPDKNSQEIIVAVLNQNFKGEYLRLKPL